MGRNADTRMLLVDKRHCAGRTVSLPAVVLAAVSLVLFGCSPKQESEPPPTVTVQVATVEEKPIQDVVKADAVLYPREQAAIVPKISAPVKKFYVQRGSKVRAGQLLAELEDRDLAGAVTENQGGYQQAEANYATASQKAQQDLVLAKQQLDAQQKIYDNRLSLLQTRSSFPERCDGCADRVNSGSRSISNRAEAIRSASC